MKNGLKILRLLLAIMLLAPLLYFPSIPSITGADPLTWDTIHLREHDRYSGTVFYRWLNTTDPDYLFIASTILPSYMGAAYMFIIFDAGVLNGKNLKISWGGPTTFGTNMVFIQDGTYNRTTDSDFPVNAEILSKGSGRIDNVTQKTGYFARVYETYGLSFSASQSQVTLFIAHYDAWSAQTSASYIYNITVETVSGTKIFEFVANNNVFCDLGETPPACGDFADPEGSSGYMMADTYQDSTTSLTLNSDQTELFRGQTLTFTSRLTSEGSGVPSEPLTVQRSEDNSTWTSINQGVTGSLGNWQLSYAQDEIGTWYFRSTYAGSGQYDSSTSSSLEILFNQVSGRDGEPPGQPPPEESPPNEQPPEDEPPPESLWCLLFGCPEDGEDQPPIITTTTTTEGPALEDGLTDIEDVFPIIRPIVEILARAFDIDPVEEPIPEFLIAIAWLLLLLLLILLILIALFGRKGRGARGR